MALYQAMALAAANNGDRWASGTLTPADEDVDVVTGLGTVRRVFVSMAETPTIDHLFSTGQPSTTSGNARIRSWRPTDNTNPTPLNDGSVVPVAVAWFAIGT